MAAVTGPSSRPARKCGSARSRGRRACPRCCACRGSRSADGRPRGHEMATLYDSAAKERASKRPPHTSVAPGIVKNNCDLVVQGKVLVRIPTLDQEVWARLTATGAGNGTGHFHVPNIDDEVLVALVHSNPVDAYILGGMWSTKVSPPIAPVPTDVPTKRVIRTGLTAAVGHEIEFDDLLQTITITSAMPPGGVQKI